jgi:hypothetical protein
VARAAAHGGFVSHRGLRDGRKTEHKSLGANDSRVNLCVCIRRRRRRLMGARY